MVTASVINSADVMGRRCGGHLSPQGPKQTFQRGRRGGRSAGIQRRPHNLSLWTQCFLRLRLHCREKLHTSSCHAVSLQSCPTLCNPMDSSLPGSSVHGISQARILEWVAGPSSRGPSQGLNPCLLRFPNYRRILYC